jgi:predicted DNA-binding protein
MAVFCINVKDGTAEKLRDLSTKTKKPIESYVEEILEEHLPDYENKYLFIDRRDCTEEEERILKLYSDVPLYSQNL